MSLFPNSVGITVGSFVRSSLKRLSSCSSSEVLLPLANSTILSGPTGRYNEVDNRLSLSMASLEASRVCSLAWILSPRVYSTNNIYQIGIFFSAYLSDYLVNVSPLYCTCTPVFFCLAYLALMADDKSSHFF